MSTMPLSIDADPLDTPPVPISELLPGSTIGIIGGGQLGRMLAMAARRLGFRLIVLDPDANCPTAAVADRCITAEYGDQAALAELAAACDVVTYEFENIPAMAVRSITRRVGVAPCADALEIAQDRYREKQLARRFDIPVAPFCRINESAQMILEPSVLSPGQTEDSSQAIRWHKDLFPGILKSRRGGYDGKGQVRVACLDDLSAACAELGNCECILEAQVPFEREASVVAVRGSDGGFAAFEPIENRHENGILRTSKVPADISESVADELVTATRRIMDDIEYIGVMAVEFFVIGESQTGQLARWMLNEIAPRVHNTAHWTIDAAYCSQFEQHIRAICGWSLGNCDVRRTEAGEAVLMHNVLGEEVNESAKWLCDPRCWLHVYGKQDARPGRKMGHVTRYALI